MSRSSTLSPVDELADRFWQGHLERQPMTATYLGDERYDDRLPDPGPVGRARERAANEEVLAAAGRIDRSRLDGDEAVTLDMLELVASIALELDDHRSYQLDAVAQIFGPQQLPSELAQIQRTDTPERFERFLARLSRYGDYIDAVRGVMEEGRADGRTAARPVVERVIAQVEGLLRIAPEDTAVVTGAGVGESDRERLLGVVCDVIRPAYGRYLDALRAYLPAARERIGLSATPNGEGAYAAAIRAATTISTTPEELHRYGLEELARIDEERAAIAARLGRRSWRALLDELDTDPANHAASAGELLERAERQIRRAEEVAPRYFTRLPGATCLVRAVEPYREQDAPFAFYYHPAMDGSRPGIYWVNTYDLPQRPLHMLATTTYHEAVPGHHFQIAIEQELEGLNEFRRFGARMAGTAFGEGWGLYAERLADEIGLFENETERLGTLSAQAWRAARLVVDTGIHAFGWERERAIRFLVDAGLTRVNAEIETDRYVLWPGQALSYMVGQREILRLRRELAERDGARFDLRGFHDATIGHGSLALDVLRRALPGWVKPLAG
ncbi:MAG: hypothetical protein A2X23_08000 [Chloroflexi bacterium GWC2_73_18]|nr:MAG: hypothetical protein A2X23_08000 [Chloroflexi bacterium GWC2_73_18]